MASNPSDGGRRRADAAGFPFLLCGLVFLGAGLAMHQRAFLCVGPALLAIGIALRAGARKRAPHD